MNWHKEKKITPRHEKSSLLKLKQWMGKQLKRENSKLEGILYSRSLAGPYILLEPASHFLFLNRGCWDQLVILQIFSLAFHKYATQISICADLP